MSIKNNLFYISGNMSCEKQITILSIETKLEAIKRIDNGDSIKKIVTDLGVDEVTTGNKRKKRSKTCINPKQAKHIRTSVDKKIKLDKSVMDDVDSTSGSDDDWEGIDEEVEISMQTLCLFCSEIFNNADLMFEHCRSQHLFDMVGYCRRMSLNCIAYIKFINYIRAHKLSSSELMEISKAQIPWNKDEYMKPCDVSDPLLTFDIESYVQEKITERNDVDEMISLPQSRFEAILQKLAYKDMKLQNAYDRIDKMKEAAKTVLLCNNHACNNQGTSGEVTRVNPDDNRTSDDDGYYSTYDHFAIHHEMLQDKVRTQAYQEAILQNPEVFSGKRVLDVGCGTAILSMFAAKAGAASVLGVDKSDVIFQAMDIVRENGFLNVIELFKGRVEDVPMTQSKVDIIVSEWMGYFLLFEGMLDSVLYARDKFLNPGGYMFPNRCTVSVIAVCDIDKYKEYIEFWDDVYGFQMSAMKKDVIKEANVETVKPEVICSEPVIVKDLDLSTCRADDADFCSTFALSMNQDCRVTALVGYFDCYFEKGLAHKVVLSTSPQSTQTHWKQTMFLLPTPVQVIKGEVVSCKISCRKNRRDPRSLIVKLNFGKCFNQYYLS